LFIDLDEAQERLKLGREEALRRLSTDGSYSLITDAISAMEGWACFKPPERPVQKAKLEKTKSLKKLQRSLNVKLPLYEEPMRSHKIGRNEPCPCESGKKYKKCCLGKAQVEAPLEVNPMSAAEFDELDLLSDEVAHLVRSGQVEKAEEVSRKLLAKYPDQLDGIEGLASVYEAKGDKLRAANYYRQAADFMRTHSGFDEEGIAWMLDNVERLEAEHEAEQDSETSSRQE
jgi:tetratricopeptide (TPR) repeat protein